MKERLLSMPGVILTSAFALVAMGCDDPPSTATASASAAATTKPAHSASPKPKSDEMPALSVDNLGAYISGERASLKEPGGPEKLKKLCGDLPIKGKQVDLAVLKKAMVTDVMAVVRELGAAGAPSVKIKADGRDDLPKELIVVPQSKLTDKAAACSVTAMVDKDLSTDVWALGGGSGKKHSKGFAGPDLTLTGETIQKAIKKCDSTVAFFSADDSLEWELAHNIGGTLMKSDDEKKIKSLVLLDEVPVPGRPVKLGP
jgi:hypothetical protein